MPLNATPLRPYLFNEMSGFESDAPQLTDIAHAIEHVSQAERDEVQALVVHELRRLQEGVLARYGLRPSELNAWKAARQLP